MVQMDLIEYLEARACRMPQERPAVESALPTRRGVSDASGRLWAVLTTLPGSHTLGEFVRCLDDHEAILTDARRFGG
jgi:hypothetical protein